MSAPVAELRSFNRFYTRQIGLLNEHLLESPSRLLKRASSMSSPSKRR